MVAHAACRGCFARFGALLLLSALGGPAAAQTAGGGPVVDADTAIAHARELTDPVKRCRPADDGSITVCGRSDTERYRLSPGQRDIANEGRDPPPKLPRAEAKAMSLDRLPYNWVPIGGRYPPGPEYNPAFELMKKRTDPANDPPQDEGGAEL